MKMSVVSAAAAALVLAVFLPGGASAVGPGKQCNGFPGIQCDAGSA